MLPFPDKTGPSTKDVN